MNRTAALILVLVIVSTLIVGCASKNQIMQGSDDKVPPNPVQGATPSEASTDQVADEAVSGWVDENQEVEIGGMI
jgi:uncharacterized lipoprotein YajG